METEKDGILRYFSEHQHRFRTDYGVTRIGVFGSAARGQMTPSSDLDVLVEMNSPTFDRYMDLKFELEDVFGVPVDLVLADSLKDRIRPFVEKDVVYV